MQESCSSSRPLCICSKNMTTDQLLRHMRQNLQLDHFELAYHSLEPEKGRRLCMTGICRQCGQRLCYTSTLTPLQQRIAELRDIGYSDREISAICGIPYKVVALEMEGAKRSILEVYIGDAPRAA